MVSSPLKAFLNPTPSVGFSHIIKRLNKKLRRLILDDVLSAHPSVSQCLLLASEILKYGSI